MARVELTPDVLDDFDRFFDHRSRFEVEDVKARIAEIGRPVKTADENS